MLEFSLVSDREISCAVFLLDITLLEPHIFHISAVSLYVLEIVYTFDTVFCFETLEVCESHITKIDTDSFHIFTLFIYSFWNSLSSSIHVISSSPVFLSYSAYTEI